MVPTLEKLLSRKFLLAGLGAVAGIVALTSLGYLATRDNTVENKIIQGQPLSVAYSCAGYGTMGNIAIVIKTENMNILATTDRIENDFKCTQAAASLNYAKEKNKTIEVGGYYKKDVYKNDIFQVESLEVEIEGKRYKIKF